MFYAFYAVAATGNFVTFYAIHDPGIFVTSSNPCFLSRLAVIEARKPLPQYVAISYIPLNELQRYALLLEQYHFDIHHHREHLAPRYQDCLCVGATRVLSAQQRTVKVNPHSPSCHAIMQITT